MGQKNYLCKCIKPFISRKHLAVRSMDPALLLPSSTTSYQHSVTRIIGEKAIGHRHDKGLVTR